MPLKKQKQGQIQSSPGIGRKTAMLTGRLRNRHLWGVGRGLGGSIVEELPEARPDEFAASFGTGLLRSDIGEGEVNADRNQGGAGGEDADRRR